MQWIAFHLAIGMLSVYECLGWLLVLCEESLCVKWWAMIRFDWFNWAQFLTLCPNAQQVLIAANLTKWLTVLLEFFLHLSWLFINLLFELQKNGHDFLIRQTLSFHLIMSVQVIVIIIVFIVVILIAWIAWNWPFWVFVMEILFSFHLIITIHN